MEVVRFVAILLLLPVETRRIARGSSPFSKSVSTHPASAREAQLYSQVSPYRLHRTHDTFGSWLWVFNFVIIYPGSTTGPESSSRMYSGCLVTFLNTWIVSRMIRRGASHLKKYTDNNLIISSNLSGSASVERIFSKEKVVCLASHYNTAECYLYERRTFIFPKIKRAISNCQFIRKFGYITGQSTSRWVEYIVTPAQ